MIYIYIYQRLIMLSLHEISMQSLYNGLNFLNSQNLLVDLEASGSQHVELSIEICAGAGTQCFIFTFPLQYIVLL